MLHSNHSLSLRRGGIAGAAALAFMTAPAAWAQTTFTTAGSHSYTVPANAIAIQV